MADVLKQLKELATLHPNWDSYGAPVISRRAIAIAQSIVPLFPDAKTLAALPTSSGGVQLEWHEGGEDVEIEIYVE